MDNATSDLDRLQGYWRLVSASVAGHPFGAAYSHWHIQGNRLQEVTPHLVEDDAAVRTTLKLHCEARPNRIELMTEWLDEATGAPFSSHRQIGFYEVHGDTFKVCFAEDDGNSPNPDDWTSGRVEVFERHAGPPPNGKPRSGTPPILDEVLGLLVWDDNKNWYSGSLPGFGKRSLILRANPGAEAKAALVRARQIAMKLDWHIRRAADFAADEMLDLKNSTWREEGESEVSAEQFKKALRLSTLLIRPDGDVEFEFDDGQLFCGHSIPVRMDSDDRLISADIKFESFHH